MQSGCNLCNQVIAAARAFLLYDADWNGAPRESWVVVHHKLGVGGLETRARHSRLQEPTPFLRSPGTLTRDEFQDLMDNHSMVSGSVHKKGVVDKMFDKADLNRDGQIDFNEFVLLRERMQV